MALPDSTGVDEESDGILQHVRLLPKPAQVSPNIGFTKRFQSVSVYPFQDFIGLLASDTTSDLMCNTEQVRFEKVHDVDRAKGSAVNLGGCLSLFTTRLIRNNA